MSRCEVCEGAEGMCFTVRRTGFKETYLRQTTYSGTASFCPRCGRDIRLHETDICEDAVEGAEAS